MECNYWTTVTQGYVTITPAKLCAWYTLINLRAAWLSRIKHHADRSITENTHQFLVFCIAMDAWRVCGVDLDVNKKNRCSLSRNICCFIPTEIAISSLGVESTLDVKKFEDGYVCRGCFREIEKVYKVQIQVNELKTKVATKVAQRVHLFQSDTITMPAHDSPSSSQPTQKRSADDLDPQHRKKRKKILQEAESMPTSLKESPDVAVNDSYDMSFGDLSILYLNSGHHVIL